MDISTLRTVFAFPNPVNEKAARAVAGGVCVLCVAVLAMTLLADSAWLWLLVPLAFGFVARVASGPRFSPLGQVATRLVAPRLGPARLVPGPPKRFAQLIGATLSVCAAVLGLGFGRHAVALVLVALILIAASLEALAGFCLGCSMFGMLMRAGVIPEDTCAACNNVAARLGGAAPASGTLTG